MLRPACVYVCIGKCVETTQAANKRQHKKTDEHFLMLIDYLDFVRNFFPQKSKLLLETRYVHDLIDAFENINYIDYLLFSICLKNSRKKRILKCTDHAEIVSHEMSSVYDEKELKN